MTKRRPAKTGAMPLDRFWTIVDGVRGETGSGVEDQGEFLDALRDRLEDLSPDDVLAFFVTYGDLQGHAYRYDLWGAAYIINGGCSEDGFVYFRAFLVAQGRRVWEAALKNPDDLARLLPEDVGDDAEFEELAYVPVEVFREKTGQELVDVAPRPSWHGRKPEGKHWENEDHLATLLPHLSKRFGGD